jgi:hypothetical protein
MAHSLMNDTLSAFKQSFQGVGLPQRRRSLFSGGSEELHTPVLQESPQTSSRNAQMHRQQVGGTTDVKGRHRLSLLAAEHKLEQAQAGQKGSSSTPGAEDWDYHNVPMMNFR